MSAITPGQVVGSFRLSATDGQPFSLWHYKQRQPVILVVWDNAGPELLNGFAERYPDYRRLGAEVLAIGRESPQNDLPFPALLDPDGATSARLADQLPAVLVLDSFGELFTRLQGDSAQRPDHEDLLEWVFFTEVQCEECGPHAENWPRRAAEG